MEHQEVGKVQAEEKHSEEQAGGHAGIMIFEGDRLLKKCKQNEISFFEWLYSHNSSFTAELKQLVPRYFGVEERKGKRYVVLENLLTECEHPNIMDCKLGKVTWTSNHTEETIKNQEAKNKLTTTGTLGFRVSGIVIKNNAGDTTEHLVKKQAFYQITLENIHEFFRKVASVDGVLNHEIVRFCIAETEKIKIWFEGQTLKTFKASSVLYVIGKNGKMNVKYIDFAHSEDANGLHDTNVIEGLTNVIEIWKRLL